MRFAHVCIEGTATVCPPLTVSSDEIEQRLQPLYQRLGLPEGRLEWMSGIRERHFWDTDYLPSQAGAEAGLQLLGQQLVEPAAIDLLIHCGVCRDRLEPATAAYVHGLLGLPATCQILDVSNACMGFVSAMVLAAGLIESGQVRHALLVSGENGRPLLENTVQALLTKDLNRKTVKPYFANLTIGAGAAAMLLSGARWARRPQARLLGGTARTDSGANRLCQGDAASMGGLEMLTEAEALLDAGIALARETWVEFLQVLDWQAQTPRHFICHQVGKTHQRRLFDELGLDRSRDFTTYETMGNMGSVSLPFTFDAAGKAGRFAAGDAIALLGIGSGLTCGMLGVQWL